MTHEAVSTGGSPWKVFVDGVEQEGEHDDEHKAIARGYRLLAENPGSEVVLRRDAEIRLTLELPTAPGPEPEPEPEPPAAPVTMMVEEVDRTAEEVVYRAAWEPVEGALGYEAKAGLNSGPDPAWHDVSSATEATVTLPRAAAAAGGYVCVRAVGDTDAGEPACRPVTVPGMDSQPGAAPVHVEDFSGYTSTEGLRAGSEYLSDGSHHEELIHLDEGPDGGQSMRYDFTARDDCGNRTIGKWMDLQALLGEGYTEVWLEVRAKFSPNFHTGEPNNGGVGLSEVSGTFELGETVGFSGGHAATVRGVQSQAAGDGTADEVYLTISQIPNRQGPARGETATGQSSGATGTVATEHLRCSTNSDYKFLLVKADGEEGSKRFSIKHGKGGDETSSTYPGNDWSRDLDLPFSSVRDFFDGAWHTYRMHWALARDGADGVSRIWIDGQLVRNWTDLDTRDHTSLGALDIGANRNAPANELMHVWWDRIRVWGEDPGWGAAEAHPNEPDGMIPITERTFDAHDEDGWDHNETDLYSIVEVDDAPVSPPKVGQMLYPEGFESGKGPSRTWRGLDGRWWTRLYVEFWHRVSPNWFGHPSEVNKILFLTRHESPGAPVIVNYEGSGDGPFHPQVRMQDGTWGNYGWDDAGYLGTPNQADITEEEARLTPGAWQRWELDLIYNTPGEADGTIRLWIDGRLILHYPRSVLFSQDVSPELMFWSGVKWDPTHGGTGGEVPAAQHQQMAYFYASVSE